MQTVTVTALRSFTHAGRTIASGEQVQVTPLDATTLRRAGTVSLTVVRARSRAMQPESIGSKPTEPTTAPPARRRQYRRRDIVASETANLSPDTDE